MEMSMKTEVISRRRIASFMQAAEWAKESNTAVGSAASSAICELIDEVNTLMNGMELAWGLISNAYRGEWEDASDEWRDAAYRWRDEEWHPALDRNLPEPLTPDEQLKADFKEFQEAVEDLIVGRDWPQQKLDRVRGLLQQAKEREEQS